MRSYVATADFLNKYPEFRSSMSQLEPSPTFYRPESAEYLEALYWSVLREKARHARSVEGNSAPKSESGPVIKVQLSIEASSSSEGESSSAGSPTQRSTAVDWDHGWSYRSIKSHPLRIVICFGTCGSSILCDRSLNSAMSFRCVRFHGLERQVHVHNGPLILIYVTQHEWSGRSQEARTRRGIKSRNESIHKASLADWAFEFLKHGGGANEIVVFSIVLFKLVSSRGDRSCTWSTTL